MLTGEKIRLSKSTVGEREARAVAEVIHKGHLGMGREVESFESRLAEFIGGQRAVICVSTGTAALHLALQASGIGSGDEVLIPTVTYLASFQAVSATGATPVACDVREDDCTLDIDDAARRITRRTKAILHVHYASGPGDLVGVYQLAQKWRLRVVEDAAHAFGCVWNGQRIGSFGDAVCFSFDGIKNITSGEGGAVVTSNPALAERVRDARLLGVERDTQKRYAGQRSWEFEVHEQGWRYHMSNIFAAIGQAQLSRLLPEFGPRRVFLARRYHQLLDDIPGVRCLSLDYGDVIPHIFPVFISGERRDAVRQALLEEDIECGIHYKPNHLLALYGGGRPSLPVAERLYQSMLTLPLHVELQEEDQDLIAGIVRRCLK